MSMSLNEFTPYVEQYLSPIQGWSCLPDFTLDVWAHFTIPAYIKKSVGSYQVVCRLLNEFIQENVELGGF